MSAARLPHVCRMSAACLSHVCRMSAARLPHVCRMSAACLSHVNGYHGCTKWVPRVCQMGATGVPNGFHGCTKWIPRVYQMGTTGVPNGYHGCTKCASGKPRCQGGRCARNSSQFRINSAQFLVAIPRSSSRFRPIPQDSLQIPRSFYAAREASSKGTMGEH